MPSLELLSGRNRRVEVEKDPIDCNQVHQEEYCSGASTLWTKPSPLLLFFYTLPSLGDLHSSISVDSLGDVQAVSGGLSRPPPSHPKERGDVYWTLTLSRELQMISEGGFSGLI
ncbi:hypothetical protein CDAR_242671 [Caerostris darwini]|uniref:Uncharacterized protein n=1 Tax=Caerostris darwini TaxID=1538125 RepID=A0AAV4N1Y9_9ARAC|nr:hypothetical protein CDAR_242671 [Caerostris darwini]